MPSSPVNPLDHFALFGLAPHFRIDEAALESAYRDLQSRVHPDRFATAAAPERRVAMQWAARANEAYQTLRDPQRRAAYLCESRGAKIQAETNTAMPTAFLMQQMEWREALDDARASGKPELITRLIDEVDHVRAATLTAIEAALDVNRDAPTASGLVRQLMFIDKFGAELAAVTDNT